MDKWIAEVIIADLVSETEKILETQKVKELAQKWVEVFENAGFKTKMEMRASSFFLHFGNEEIVISPGLQLKWEVEGSTFSVQPYIVPTGTEENLEELVGEQAHPESWPVAMQVAGSIFKKIFGGELVVRQDIYEDRREGYVTTCYPFLRLPDVEIRLGSFS